MAKLTLVNGNVGTLATFTAPCNVASVSPVVSSKLANFLLMLIITLPNFKVVKHLVLALVLLYFVILCIKI